MAALEKADLAAKPARKITATLQERVYKDLRQRIITGRFLPGRAVTLRGLAELLGTSPMPVREALRRLVAENALEMRPNRRIAVPRMTAEKFADLCAARLTLEPLAATRALPVVDRARLARLRTIDAELDRSVAAGDIEGCLLQNYAFHFTLYGFTPTPVLPRLIESLWMQTGPFMRLTLNRLGASYVVDRHHEALSAIEAGNAAALRAAIEADIEDGMVAIPAVELRGLSD